MNVQATIAQLEKLRMAGITGVYKAMSGLSVHERPDLDYVRTTGRIRVAAAAGQKNHHVPLDKQAALPGIS